MNRRSRWLAGGLVLLALMPVGCNKPAANNPPSNPAPAPTNPQPAPVVQPTVPGSSGIARPDQRVVSANRLKQIGLAYTQQAILGPVTGPADLGKDIQLTDGRQQPFEIVWGIDLDKVRMTHPQALLAWEKDPDSSGTRQVLRVDGSVTRLSADEFQKAPRAKP